MLKNHFISRVLSLLILFGIVTSMVHAGEPAFLRESIRARGMGNAFTAVANDEMVLFYNPAGLRSVQYNFYELLAFNVTTNENTLKVSESSDTSNEISSLTGKKLYNEINLSLLSHVNSRFGWSIFNNTLIDIQLHNPIIPQLKTNAYTQGGLIAGIAWSFFDFKLDIGISGKVVQRAGTQTTFSVFDEAIVDATNGKTEKLEKKFANKSSAAPDFGFTYHIDSVHNLNPKISMSLLNIGGLDFEAAGKIPMTVNLGLATESELQGIDFILSADYHDLTNNQKLATGSKSLTERNFKIGFEAGWEKLFNGHHFVSIRMGRNGPYNSVGGSLNLFGIKFDLAKYSEEVGGYAGDIEDKRISLQMKIIF